MLFLPMFALVKRHIHVAWLCWSGRFCIAFMIAGLTSRSCQGLPYDITSFHARRCRTVIWQCCLLPTQCSDCLVLNRCKVAHLLRLQLRQLPSPSHKLLPQQLHQQLPKSPPQVSFNFCSLCAPRAVQTVADRLLRCRCIAI